MTTATEAASLAEASKCQCYRCLTERDAKDSAGWPIVMTRMVLCPTCGCKRCPHATDHRYACTDSNESGQVGSRYGVAALATTPPGDELKGDAKCS